MVELRENNGIKYASAKELHFRLGLNKSNFTQWIRRVLLNKPFIENIDFSYLAKKSTGGRPSIDYLLTEQTAISVIMISGGKKAHEIRNEVVEAFRQKKTGISLTVDQVTALTDIVKAMTLVSVQKNAENKHYNFLGRPKDWWKYRAELLGYSTESLKNALLSVGKKYKSQKQALIHIDPAEIIRTGVIDILIALGRDHEYSINIGEWAKAIAKSNGYHFQIWDDTKANPLGINKNVIEDRKKLI